MTQEQIENIFSYHKPFGDQAERYEVIRYKARCFAELLNDAVPDSPEKALAFRKLQECVMFANAAIAINEKEPVNG